MPRQKGAIVKIVRSAILALVTLLALAPVTPLRAQELPVVRVGKPEAAALTFMAIEIGESVAQYAFIRADQGLHSDRTERIAQRLSTRGGIRQAR